MKDYPANGVFSHMSDKKKPLKTKGCRTIFTKTHFFVAIANRFAIVRLSPVSDANNQTNYDNGLHQPT